MLPLHDVMPSPVRAYVTLTLVFLGSALAAHQLWLSPFDRLSQSVELGFTPAQATITTFLTGLLIWPDLVAAGFGLLALWIFGENVEGRLGRGRYLLILIAGAGLAAAASARLDPASEVVLPVSAGAIAVAVGAHLALFPSSRIVVTWPTWRGLDFADVPATIVAASWLVLHAMRHAGSWLAPTPGAGPLVLPVVGALVGAACARGLARRDRMAPAWWSPSPSERPTQLP